MNWIDFIDTMSNLSGTNDKIDFIKENDDINIRRLLVYTYDPSLTYGIRSETLDYSVGGISANNKDLLEFTNILDKLSLRDLTGNAARNTVNEFVSQYVEADYFVKILNGSLDIGIGKTNINKAIPKLINVFKVTLAKKYKWDGKLPFKHTLVSQKYDGVRCIAIKEGDSVRFYSRTGKLFTTLDLLKPEMLSLPFDNIVLDGEIIKGDGTGKHFQPLMKKIRKKDYTMTDFKYVVFDSASIEEFYGKVKTPYIDRQFNYRFEDTIHIKKTKQIMAHSYYDINDFWNAAMLDGWEGIMLRNGDSPYEAKRTKNLLKMKVMQDEEFEVVGYQEGTGKYRNSLGSMGVNVDGKTVWVGSGFSDSARDDIWYHKPLRVMVTIQYFEKTEDGSLRFPVFKEFRNSL